VSQFLGFVIFFVIAGSFALHAGLELPWFLEWIGNLPGDLIVKKENLTIYLPVTSSVIVSVLLSFISSLFSK
jgi:hypothetical protein